MDCHHCKIKKSWWPDEVLTKADVAAANSDGGVTVSHYAPARVAIPNIDRKLG